MVSLKIGGNFVFVKITTVETKDVAKRSGLLEWIKDTEFGDSHFDPTSEADIRAARSRKLECEVNEDRTLTVSYKNIGAVEVNFYVTSAFLFVYSLDVQDLFSSKNDVKFKQTSTYKEILRQCIVF